jgi:tripartite-type tricarboxylate transporter receptor subunit TctC
MRYRRSCFSLALAVLSFVACAAALAQTWPSKPINIIVPVTAGSASDVVARMVGQLLSKQLAQPFVVENRPGAVSAIGTNYVARSEPDGYTALVVASAHTLLPSTSTKLPYDAANDFAGVTTLISLPLVMVVTPAKDYRSIQDLVAAGKTRPNSLNYATVGMGGATHLAAERFRLSAGFEAVPVPFRGAPEALTEVISGRVDFCILPISAVIGLINDGKVLPLAVTGSKRAAALPNVPTMIEAGLPNSDYNSWIGLFLPAKTPRTIVNKLHEETAKAMQDAELQQRLSKLGAEPLLMKPEDFDALIRSEINMNAALVKAAGITPN